MRKIFCFALLVSLCYSSALLDTTAQWPVSEGDSLHTKRQHNAFTCWTTPSLKFVAKYAAFGSVRSGPVIDANGNVTSIPPNEAYSMDGTEKYVNSGWLWPSGQSPPGFPAIDTFSVKFTKAGTFNYMCEVHPWMTGQVNVK